MKTLLIMRHGTSEGNSEDGSDINRVLTNIGEAEAFIQGRFLEHSGIMPQFIAASTAVRARTTADMVLDALSVRLSINFADVLYNASGKALLDFTQNLPPSADTALLVAHMPGVAELLAMVTSDFAEVTIAYAPATLSCAAFPHAKTWKDVQSGEGRLEWLLPPLMLG